jgi:hemoglobin
MTMTVTIPAGTPAPAGLPAATEPCVPADGEAMSLYQAIGGRAALVAAVDGLFGRLLADPELAPFFPRGVGDRHRRYVVTLLSQALGGPHRYRGPDLAESHRGLGITGSQFARTAAHLGATLDELGVPASLADRIVAVVGGVGAARVGAGRAAAGRPRPGCTPRVIVSAARG